MSDELVQCIPNFSEGRQASTLEALANAIRLSGDVRLVDWSADADHNRSVFTFLGTPESVSNAAIEAARVAVDRIDLNRHKGVHPRLGSIDVIPFVPVRGIAMAECSELARRTASALAEQLSVPVFLYEEASSSRLTLPQIRRGAFSQFQPDFGPSTPHPTAGAVVCGARAPLIAFNANLDSTDLALARTIASDIRASFPSKVRALGLALKSRNIVQVSMNVVRPQDVALVELVAFIGRRASILETEVIGVMPEFAALELAATGPYLPQFEAWSGTA